MESRELASKWKKERLERYKAKLMARNGGKPILDERIIGLASTPSKCFRVEGAITKKISANPKRKLSSINPPKIKPKENKLSIQRQISLTSSVLKMPSRSNSFTQNATPKKFREYNSRRSVLDIKGLSGWLTKRGKLDKFKKLQEFYKLPNLDAPQDGQNSEISSQDFSVEFCISLLQELMDLMKQGYPKSECCKVFESIAERCNGLNSEPIYYECLGMFRDPTRINIDKENNPPLAEKIGEFDQKLRTIDISPLKPFEPQPIIAKEDIIQSYSIQFAIMESGKKQISPVYAVTPVRRGTRSRTTTPASVKYVSNMNDLTPNIKSKFTFKPNKFLF